VTPGYELITISCKELLGQRPNSHGQALFRLEIPVLKQPLELVQNQGLQGSNN